MTTPEETLRLLSEKAKTSSDRFVIKVNRRRGMAGLPEHIATLSDATVNHIASPETWLPALCGGGDYGLLVSHMDEVSLRIGTMLAFKFTGAPRDTVNAAAVSAQNWNGPSTLIFPSVTEASGLPSGFTGSTASGPAVHAGYGLPPNMSAPGVPTPPVWFDERTERERERLARESRELVEQKAKTDKMLADREFEVRAQERESKLREELAAKQRDIEAKMAAAASNTSGTKDLIVGLAPLVMGFLESQSRARADAARASEESQRRFMEMMQAQNAQTQALMMQMNQNKGIDPSMAAVLEMMRANANGSAEMMSRIVDAMGSVSKTSVGMIEAIADIQLGGAPEHPMLIAVREGVKAMSALSQGAQSGARKVVQNSQKQLPGATVNPAPAPGKPPARSAPKSNGATARAQPAAQVVHEVPNAPAPNLPPANEGAPQNVAFDGPPSEVPGVGAPIEGQAIEQLKALIEAHHEPVEEVARFFIEALKTEELKAAVNEREGDINRLISDELGLWAMSASENAEYLGKLGPVVQRLGESAGIFASEEEIDEDGESPDAP